MQALASVISGNKKFAQIREHVEKRKGAAAALKKLLSVVCC